MGLYFRFVNEIVIRRTFLDRRACVESTLRLNFEKEQEVSFPRQVLRDIWTCQDFFIKLYSLGSMISGTVDVEHTAQVYFIEGQSWYKAYFPADQNSPWCSLKTKTFQVGYQSYKKNVLFNYCSWVYFYFLGSSMLRSMIMSAYCTQMLLITLNWLFHYPPKNLWKLWMSYLLDSMKLLKWVWLRMCFIIIKVMDYSSINSFTYHIS